MSRSSSISHETLPAGKAKKTTPSEQTKDLLESDGGPLVADNSWLNALFIPSCIDDMELGAYAFRVLCHLKRRADQSGKAFPGMRSIAQKCCLSVSTVCRAVKELQSRGVLHVQERGENVSNLYLLTNPDEWKGKDGKPFNHPNKIRQSKEGAVSIANRGVSIANSPVSERNSGVSIGNSPVSDRNERVSKEGDLLKGIQNKAIQKEPTTTPRACAQEAEPVTEEKAVVVVSSGVGGVEEEAKHRDEKLEALKAEFRLTQKQAGEVRRIAKDKGLTYVEERAEYTRKNATENDTAYFLKALRADFQLPVKPDRKAKRRHKPEPKPEEAPLPPADYSEELAFWRGLNRQERKDWKNRIDPLNVWRKVTEDTETPGNVFLGALAAIRKGRQTEGAANLVQEAACAATALISAQQPTEEAA